jgi:hypothetical protein
MAHAVRVLPFRARNVARPGRYRWFLVAVACNLALWAAIIALCVQAF